MITESNLADRTKPDTVRRKKGKKGERKERKGGKGGKHGKEGKKTGRQKILVVHYIPIVAVLIKAPFD